MENKIEFENRYRDIYTFSKTDGGDILFEGEFKWMRCGWPNVYNRAYEAYCADVDTDERMTMGEFKEAIHEYDKETFESTPLSKKYRGLIYSDQTKIDMIDPSGGPYISIGTDMSHFGGGLEGVVTHIKMSEKSVLLTVKK